MKALIIGLTAVTLLGATAIVRGQEERPVQLMVGDTTCDLEVTSVDALVTLRQVAGMQPIGGECTPVGSSYQVVPACMEDEVIIGYGDFHSDGLWDHYRCEHPDNLQQPTE